MTTALECRPSYVVFRVNAGSPDARVLQCTKRGCRSRARWQPVLYVPIETLHPHGVRTNVSIKLPLVVCNLHKLQHNVEEKLLRNRVVRRALGHAAATLGDCVVLAHRAWLVHERIEDAPS